MKYVAALLALVLAGCTSQDFYRGRVTATGQATAQAFRVVDGVEQPVTSLYTLSGQGSATAQSTKPYLTLDGSWEAGKSAAAVPEEPDAVLIRRPAAALKAPAPRKTIILDGVECEVSPVVKEAAAPVPFAADPCAPTVKAAPVAAEDCRPSYVSPCTGVVGGTRPEPIGALDKPIPPGTGWPCGDSAGPKGLGAVPAAAVGIPVHVVGCFIEFLRCAIGGAL